MRVLLVSVKCSKGSNSFQSGVTVFDEYKAVRGMSSKACQPILPGGFDHFDWVVYDEVHALDGDEGDALQRLIRSINCKFLSLSATVGNAEELRAWMERAKGDQILGVESVDVLRNEPFLYGTAG